MVSMQWIAVEAIKPNARNARTHSKKQIRQIADSIAAFGFLVPILTEQGGRIIAGHGRYAAAVLLGLQEVPVIQVEGLSEAKRRALALADNKIAAPMSAEQAHVKANSPPQGLTSSVRSTRA
jgi:ParB-like chromosome segregation protein Spo0J